PLARDRIFRVRDICSADSSHFFGPAPGSLVALGGRGLAGRRAAAVASPAGRLGVCAAAAAAVHAGRGGAAARHLRPPLRPPAAAPTGRPAALGTGPGAHGPGLAAAGGIAAAQRRGGTAAGTARSPPGPRAGPRPPPRLSRQPPAKRGRNAPVLSPGGLVGVR